MLNYSLMLRRNQWERDAAARHTNVHTWLYGRSEAEVSLRAIERRIYVVLIRFILYSDWNCSLSQRIRRTTSQPKTDTTNSKLHTHTHTTYSYNTHIHIHHTHTHTNKARTWCTAINKNWWVIVEVFAGIFAVVGTHTCKYSWNTHTTYIYIYIYINIHIYTYI